MSRSYTEREKCVKIKSILELTPYLDEVNETLKLKWKTQSDVLSYLSCLTISFRRKEKKKKKKKKYIYIYI